MRNFLLQIQSQAAQQEQYDQLAQISYWIIFLLALFLLGLIIVMYVRKITRGGHSTLGQTHDVTDLYSVKDKGLLTPEEMKSVRDAIVRQVKREQEEARQKKSLGDLAIFATQLKEKQEAEFVARKWKSGGSEAAAGPEAFPIKPKIPETAYDYPAKPPLKNPNPPQSLPKAFVISPKLKETGAETREAPVSSEKDSMPPEPSAGLEPPAGLEPSAASAANSPDTDLPPTAPAKPAAMDIDALLAKGIIGETEYNQLRAHFRNKK